MGGKLLSFSFPYIGRWGGATSVPLSPGGWRSTTAAIFLFRKRVMIALCALFSSGKKNIVGFFFSSFSSSLKRGRIPGPLASPPRR